ncbi:ROK family protein [Psychromicrobium xiongbiense]|uniref:ROK family protein n=1 Tax=Psychromicrobium xiongbiense TaxID=3051184 RepID=UPI0025523E27|nr:ROK family protein [Psychromicrobium sp. YIM S02556]
MSSFSVPSPMPETELNSAVLAFDVGGTDTKAGLVLAAQPGQIPHIVDIQRFPTALDAERPGEVLVDFLAELTGRYRAAHPEVNLNAVGVTVPGLVDETEGVGVYAANFGWHGFPFRAVLEQRLGVPVAFGHDVSTAGDAEVALGAAQNAHDVMILVIGTGVAAALYVDGRRLQGGGFAGEVGHALVPLANGERHIMEAIGSAGGLTRRYRALHTDFTGGAREVLAAMQAGDDQARVLWADAVDAIAFSISQAVAFMGTTRVVIGGGLAEAGEALFEPLRARIDELLTFQPRPEVVKASLGQDAGLIGSAMKAQQRHSKHSHVQRQAQALEAQP